MRRTVRINATLDADLLDRIDAFARSRHEDRSTALRQLAEMALRQLTQREALAAFGQGRLTLRELGRTLRLTTWETHDLLAAEGVAVAQGARAETAAALAAVLAAASGADGALAS
ncbi:MAG TPA: ribbon-helix-helix protein, CopG family [Candidatus Micrarchaeia archaeon]|nr:ribbon-helix-helix protein, CopG family [Candidatus Micrarchaeia archaeon]